MCIDKHAHVTLVAPMRMKQLTNDNPIVMSDMEKNRTSLMGNQSFLEHAIHLAFAFLFRRSPRHTFRV